MRAFEIHTFHGGRWKIDSIYDDRELAMYEAQRIERSGRFPGIRVIEEVFNEETQQTRTRTIFRGSKLERDNRENFERSIELRKQSIAEQKRRAAEYQERRRRYLEDMRRRRLEPYRLAMVFATLILLGIAALIGLQHVREFL